MIIKNIEFKPKLIFTLFSVGILFLLLKLAYWQYQRGIEKQKLESNYKSLAEAIDVTSLTSEQQKIPYLNIIATGTLDTAHNFLQDNKTYQGRVGYHVLTPMHLTNSKKILLIDLGWIPNTNRNILPEFKKIPETVTLSGKLMVPSSKYLQLSEQNMENNWPKRIQFVKIPEMADALEALVLPFVLAANPSIYTYKYNLAARYLTPSKHFGYATQWLLLAITYLILYLVVSCHKVNNK